MAYGFNFYDYVRRQKEYEETGVMRPVSQVQPLDKNFDFYDYVKKRKTEAEKEEEKKRKGEEKKQKEAEKARTSGMYDNFTGGGTAGVTDKVEAPRSPSKVEGPKEITKPKEEDEGLEESIQNIKDWKQGPRHKTRYSNPFMGKDVGETSYNEDAFNLVKNKNNANYIRGQQINQAYRDLAEMTTEFEEYGKVKDSDINQLMAMGEMLGQGADIASQMLVPDEIKDLDKKLDRIAGRLKEGEEGVIYTGVEAWNRRQVMSMLAGEYVRKMNDLPNKADYIEEWIQDHPEIYPHLESMGETTHWFKKAIRGAVDVTALWINGATNKDTVKLASNMATGMGLGAWAINALPGMGLVPEEIITVPTAMLIGAKKGIDIGTTKHMMMLEAGGAYSEYIEEGIPHEIAKPIATTVGVVNGMIEKMQLDLAFKSVPGVMETVDSLKKKAFQEAAKGLTKVAMNYGLVLVPEALEEILQESATNAGLHLAELINSDEAISGANVIKATFKDQINAGKFIGSLVTGKETEDSVDGKEYLKDMLEVGKETMISFMFTPIIGTATDVSMQRLMDNDTMRTMGLSDEQKADYKKARAELDTALSDANMVVDNYKNAKVGELSTEDYGGLITYKNTLEALDKRPDLSKNQKDKIKSALDGIDSIVDESIYKAKEVDPSIIIKSTDKNMIEAEILKLDTFVGYELLNTDLTDMDLDNYKYADKYKLTFPINEALNQGREVGEIANNKEILDRMPRKDRSSRTLMSIIESIESMNDEINAQRIINGVENIDNSLSTIESDLRNKVLEEGQEVKIEEDSLESHVIEQEDTKVVEGIEEAKDIDEGLEKATIEPVEKTEGEGDRLVEEPRKSTRYGYEYSETMMVPLADINVDAERFQFRFDGDRADRLRGANYNEQLAGTILLYEDTDGSLYVVNGHNRVRLAQENRVNEMKAEIISHRDYSVEEARAFGAMLNIAEDNASAIDVAKLIRDTGVTEADFADVGVKPNSKIAKDGLALAELDDWLFMKTALRQFPLERAVLIGNELAGNFEGQKTLIESINKLEERGANITDARLKELIGAIKGTASDEFEEITMLGEEFIRKNLFVEKAELLDYAKSQLKSRVSILKNVSKERNTSILEQLGNTIRVDDNVQSMSQAEQALFILDKTVHVAETNTNALFNDMAKRYSRADSKERASIKKEALNSFIRLMEKGTAMNDVVTPRTMKADAYTSMFGVEAGPVDTSSMQDNQASIFGEKAISDFQSSPSLDIIVSDKAKDTKTYKDTIGIAEAMKNNVFLNGLTVEYTGEPSVKYWTRRELDEAGYRHFEEGEYEIRGVYSHQSTETGRISINDQGDRTTILEEAIHHIQRRAGEISPEFFTLMRDWESEIRFKAKEIGYDIPGGVELFAQAYIYSELGYADIDPRFANDISLDDELVTMLETMLGPEVIELARGDAMPTVPKTERALKSEFRGIAERLLKKETFAKNLEQAVKHRLSSINRELEAGQALRYYSPDTSSYAIINPSEDAYKVSFFDRAGEFAERTLDNIGEVLKLLEDKGLYYKQAERAYQLAKFDRSNVDEAYASKQGKALSNAKIASFYRDAGIGNFAPRDYDRLILNNDKVSPRVKSELVTRIRDAIDKGYYLDNKDVGFFQFLNRFYGVKAKGHVFDDANMNKLNGLFDVTMIYDESTGNIEVAYPTRVSVDAGGIIKYRPGDKFTSLTDAVEGYLTYLHIYGGDLGSNPKESSLLNNVIKRHFLYDVEAAGLEVVRDKVLSQFYEFRDNMETYRHQGLDFGFDEPKSLSLAELYPDDNWERFYQLQPNYEVSYETKTVADTDTDEFKKWFKDSKVVDEDGRPLVVYHGTPYDFNIFDENKIGSSTGNLGFYGKGFYFTDSKYYADLFGDAKEFYISLQNPYTINKTTSLSEIAELTSANINNEHEIQLFNIEEMIKGNEETFRDSLIKAGYDGVIMSHLTDKQEIVVFNPTQIKSIYNKGMFSEYNPDINFQLKAVDEDTQIAFYTLDEGGSKYHNIGEYRVKTSELVDDKGLKTLLVESDGIINDSAIGFTSNQILREAVEGGFDRISWDNKEEQVMNHIVSNYREPGEAIGERMSIPVTPKMIESVMSEGQPIFQLSPTGEEGGNLLAMHNLDENKLKGAMRLGGFPAPSIAIARTDMPLTNFGDISLVFDKETIDPSIRANKVFASDVYSPLFPKMGHDIDSTKLRAFNQEMSDRGLGNFYLGESDLYGYSPREAAERYSNKNQFKEAYIESIGEKIEPPMKERGLYHTVLNSRETRKYAKEHVNSFKDLIDNKELREGFYKAIKESYLVEDKPFFRNMANDVLGKIENEINFHINHGYMEDNYVKNFNNDLDTIKGLGEMVVDEYGYSDLMDEVIKKDRKAYIDFVEGLLEPFYRDMGLRNKKDTFTPSGNRRSFKALHDDYTVDNALRLMKGDIRAAEGFNYGLGSIRATVTPEFTSIADIKANVDKLVNKETFDNAKKLQGDRYISLASELRKYNPSDLYSQVDYVLQELGREGNIDELAVVRKFKEWDYGVSDMPRELIAEVADFMSELVDMPTEYFEAKPQRAIRFDEVKAVVAPMDLSPELEAEIRSQGVTLIEKYDRGVEGDRTRAINDITREKGIAFQLKNPEGSWSANNIDSYYNNEGGDFEVRSWPETVANAEITSPELRNLLLDNKMLYEVKHNADTMILAAKLIDDKGVNWVEARILSDLENDVILFGASQILGVHFMEAGETQRAIDLISKTAEKATSAGQAIQILSWIGRQSPESISRHTIKAFRDLMTGDDLNRMNKAVTNLVSDFNRINANAMNQIDLVSELKGIKDMTSEDMLVERVKDSLVTPREKEATSILIDTLVEVAKETPIDKEVPNNPMNLLVDALINKNEYQGLWEKVKNLLQQRYKDNPDLLASLDSYMDQDLEAFKASKLKTGDLDTISTRVADIVKDHFSKGDPTRQSLTDKLVDNTELNRQEAELLVKKIGKQFERLTKDTKEKALGETFKEKTSFERKGLDAEIIKLSNEGALKDSNYNGLVAEKLGLPVMTKELQDYIYNQANYIQTLEEGSRERDVATAQLMKEISDHIPVGKWRKLNTFQTMAHLLNPKTTMRNLIGNAMFSGLDSFRHHFIGAPMDYMVSKFTGERTALFRPIDSIKEQAKGYKQGMTLGIEDALLGINTFEDGGKYDLKPTRSFKGGVMGSLETVMDITMRATDRASQTGAFMDYLKEQMLIAGVDTPTDQMIENAELLGAYRTFNDTTRLSEGFGKIKEGLNKFGHDDFGLGEIIMKYPRTPANILGRGIDYSPIGLVNTMVKLYTDTSGDAWLKQKMAVEGITRSLLGTGLIYTGALLAKYGMITGGRAGDEEDIYRLKKQYGIRDYSVNKSAIMRWIQSGFSDMESGVLRPGDKLASYDWAEPIGMSIGIGADAVLGRGEALDLLATVGGLVDSQVTSITSQPMLMGVSKLFQYGIEEGASQMLKDLPNSFTPIVFGQIAQFMDGRNTNPYDMYSKGRVAYNLVANKIPGLRNALPSRYSALGDEQRYYPEDKNIVSKFMDVFFNPSIKVEYNAPEELEFLVDLYEATGSVDHIPKGPQKSYTIDKIKYTFTPEEWETLSRDMGTLVKSEINRAMTTYARNWTPEEQVMEIAYLLNEIKKATRERVKVMKGVVEE